VRHETAFHAEFAEGGRERLDPAFIVDADDHVRRLGGIDERAEDVEDGLRAAFSDLLTHPEDSLEGRMKRRGVEVAEVRLGKAAE